MLLIVMDLLLSASPWSVYPQWLEDILASHFTCAAVIPSEICYPRFVAMVHIRILSV